MWYVVFELILSKLPADQLLVLDFPEWVSTK